jgi:uncharacterized protein YjbJ (UPF0337 family)
MEVRVKCVRIGAELRAAVSVRRCPSRNEDNPKQITPMKRSTHDRVEGSAKVVRGKAKVAAGKATKNRSLQARGHLDKLDGRLQKAAGDRAKVRGR